MLIAHLIERDSAFWEVPEGSFDPSAWLILEWDRTPPGELGWDISIGSWFVPDAVPVGFPSFYRPELPALTVGPIGRLIQSTQCMCGHDELQHIRILDECLGGCDCPRFRLRTPTEALPGWRERLRRLIRRGRS